MKLEFITALVIAIALLFAVQSCEKENETTISAHGANESHKSGENCMNCHKKEGSGEGWFNVAGTVYDSLKINTFKNATVKLYTDFNDLETLKYTIQVDALGNFYTTENIDFGDGLYTIVQGSEFANKMLSKITNGQCNSCHGSTTGKIWAK